MAGTKAGALKAAATNKAKYGKDFYRELGRKGGKLGHTGGFAANPTLARLAGAKGGKKSKRGPSEHTIARIKRANKLLGEGLTIEQIAWKMGKTVPTICEYIHRGKDYDIQA